MMHATILADLHCRLCRAFVGPDGIDANIDVLRLFLTVEEPRRITDEEQVAFERSFSDRSLSTRFMLRSNSIDIGSIKTELIMKREELKSKFCIIL